MADTYTFGDISDSGNVVDDSANDNSTNTDTAVDVDLDTVGNTDNSDNLAVGISDSFNEESNDTTTTWDNVGNDTSDNSINDSGNDSSDNSVNDSNNTANFTFDIDNSVNAGNREYNTGLGGGDWASALGGGEGGSGGGSSHVWSSATIVDQSTNVVGDGDAGSDNFAVVASGEGALAVGGDVDQTWNVDESTNISADGDSSINIGSTVDVTNTVGSYNTVEVSNYDETNTTDIDITDSGNSFDFDASADGSFNDVDYSETNIDVTADVDAIVDSEGSFIGDDFVF